MEQDIPVYVLANFVVSDKDQYRVYEKASSQSLSGLAATSLPSTTPPKPWRGPPHGRGAWSFSASLPKPKLALGGRTKSIKRSNTDGRAQR